MVNWETNSSAVVFPAEPVAASGARRANRLGRGMGFFAALVAFSFCHTERVPKPPPVAARSPEADAPRNTVPDWAADAVFYQIFPERFRNGDPSNDPTRTSLEFPDLVPESWAISPWTGDWYARAPWERQLGTTFYDDGVFHRRYGGDLQGVLDKLDYLRQLGINTIYFNPVFYARSLHKYDGNTFHHIDPYFGPDPEGDFASMARETSEPRTWRWTAADRLFLKLVREAHARQIRIIIDGVFNHTGRDFFAFADLMENQAKSPYKEWYIVESFDDPATPVNEFRYKGWWGVKTLPEFADNHDKSDLHPGPRKYIFDATKRWMDPDGDGDPSDGIDGWRLDVANEVPMKFWSDWNAYVRKLNPEAYTVTEFWQDASEFLREGGFSASMNYHGFAFLTKGFLIDGAMKATEFAEKLETRRKEYPHRVQFAMQNLIDGHDTERLASMIVNARHIPYKEPDRFDYDVGNRVSPRWDGKYDVRGPNEREREILRLVALFQMTYVGAPMIYYGTEAGMWGGDDPDDRMPMVWPELTYEPQAADPLGRSRKPEPVDFDDELFEYYRQLIALRGERKALRRGTFEVLATLDEAQTLVFSRRLEKENLVIILNRSEEPQSISVRLELAGALRPILATAGSLDAFSVLSPVDGTVALVVPARTGVVYEAIGRH